MNVISPIIEECFLHYLHPKKKYNNDPELLYQLTSLDGYNIQDSLMLFCKKSNFIEYSNYSENTVFHIICDFLNYCNNKFNINIIFENDYNKWLILYYEKNKEFICNYSHLFKKNINYLEFSNILLENGNPIYVYWAIPNYNKFGKLIPFTEITLIGSSVTIGDIYRHIGSTLNDYSDLYPIIKNSKLTVKKYAYGICIECY
jgi:hypothetical protein